FSHSASMDRELRRRTLGVGDLHKIATNAPNNSSVTNLSSRLPVKGRLGSNNIDFFSLDGLWLSVAVAVDPQAAAFALHPILSNTLPVGHIAGGNSGGS